MSEYGFGHEPFGNFPFGNTDFGANVVSRQFPPEYLYDDDGNLNTRLYHYLQTIENEVNTRKQEIDNLPDQVDFNRVRSDLLQYLGSTISVTLDDYEPEEFKRSLVGNAIQFYQKKGTDEAYRIRGKISGYDVDFFNIYRIQESSLYKSISDFEIGLGNGGASQQFTGITGTFPVLKSSLQILVNGTPVAQDDGSGGFVSLSAYAVGGTLDYSTGAYDFTLTPSPLTGEVVTLDFETGIEDAQVAVGNGVLTSFTYQQPFYPSYVGSFKLYVNGVLVGEDDGSYTIVTVSGSPYSVNGSINQANGFVQFQFGTPIPNGDVITASYDKTFLSEFLVNYPEDIYEIPDGSGVWYTTVEPGVIPGGPSEIGCDYCLTSFVKIRLTLVKSIAGGLGGGSENFFDRLIRKLREIVPAHVRDLLYELVIVIVADESENLDGGISENQELNWLSASEGYYFDIVPADVVETDKSLYVTGTVELI
jgi:hypothetical protein